LPERPSTSEATALVKPVPKVEEKPQKAAQKKSMRGARNKLLFSKFEIASTEI
jgi:hypothetical protein